MEDQKQRLVDLINSTQKVEENPDTKKEYRYVIYCRKSTDEKDKQVSSLQDQLSECKEFAENNNLKITRVIQESVSAKQAGIRPLFREMIIALENHKFDGIIAWHPDRLARNMKDAGEIIDLVDKGDIKDLKFASFNFENSASGKMHLGITFVLSKHYSDHLSDSVSRGNKRRVEEGKLINRPRHGYKKDFEQFLRPDTYNDNFILIKNAFKMRLNKSTLDEIADYLNENNYSVSRKNKKGEEIHLHYKMRKQVVADFMKDPVYTGVLWYGKNQAVDLTKLYNFEPIITVEEFFRINKLSNKKELVKLSKSYYKGGGVKANLLIDTVFCDKCGMSKTAGITPKKNKKGDETKRYFYYRCDTEDCPRRGKSTRAKVVIDYVCNYLSQKPFSSESSYKHYVEEMERVSAQRTIDAKRNLRALQSELVRLEEKIDRTKAILGGNEDESVKELFRADLQPTQEKIKEVEARIAKLQTFINAGKESIVSYSEFLELMEKMPKIIRGMKNMKELDYIIRKIFLNFTVDLENVVKSTLNSPFDVLKTLKVSIGARERT